MHHPHRLTAPCGGSGAGGEHKRGSSRVWQMGSYFHMRKCGEARRAREKYSPHRLPLPGRLSRLISRGLSSIGSPLPAGAARRAQRRAVIRQEREKPRSAPRAKSLTCKSDTWLSLSPGAITPAPAHRDTRRHATLRCTSHGGDRSLHVAVLRRAVPYRSVLCRCPMGLRSLRLCSEVVAARC